MSDGIGMRLGKRGRGAAKGRGREGKWPWNDEKLVICDLLC